MKLIALVAAGVMVASAGTAHADDWRIIGAFDDTAVGLDRESIRTNGSKRTFWAASVNAEPDERGVRHSLFRIEVDCDAETIEFLSINYYAGDPAPVYSSDGSGDAMLIIPGSTGEMMQRAVCENQWTDGSYDWIEGSFQDVTEFIREVRQALIDTRDDRP